VSCSAHHPIAKVNCHAPLGHKADGKTSFAFHAGYNTKGKLVIWTDDDLGKRQTRKREPDSTQLRLRLIEAREEVRGCESQHVVERPQPEPIMTDSGDILPARFVQPERFQCEKVDNHQPFHTAHRADGSLVVWE
jgi:hypothetical protein